MERGIRENKDEQLKWHRTIDTQQHIAFHVSFMLDEMFSLTQLGDNQYFIVDFEI